MARVGESMCFFSVTDQKHSTLTICLNRPYEDGSFLVVETMTRPDFVGGVTTSRVFHGKAKPTPMFEAWLKAKGKK